MAYRLAPSFCRHCGAPGVQPGRHCPSCGTLSTVAPAAADDGAGASRGFFSALALFFVLLTTLLVPLAVATEVDAAWLDRLLVLDAVLVAGWVLAHRRRLAPQLTTLGRPRDWLIATGAVPLTVAVALGNVALMHSMFGAEPIELTDLYALAGYPLWAALLAHAVQPAVVEELAFRGVMFEAFERVMEPRTVVIVTALMFMVLHLALLGLVFLVVMGLLLGWLRLRSGSIYPAMWLHLCHNTVMIVLDWPG